MSTACRFVSTTEPRVLADRHLDICQCPPERPDRGCAPCPEPHCTSCGRVHANATCAECLAVARDDLQQIAALCGALPTESVHRGVNSEAAMLWGPTADPEAWRNRAMSAMMGRVDAAYLEDCRDEMHPLFVLGTWEQLWRSELDHPTEQIATLPRLVDYLDQQMTYMASRSEPPFEDFARDLRGCRAHLEDVVSEGLRAENGAPCVQCGKTMTRVTNDRDPYLAARRKGSPKEGAQDLYECKPCRRTVTGDHYRFAVGAAYRAHADRLTASDLLSQYGVKGGSVRGWASLGKVRKRGKDAAGRQLYDVADVLAMSDEKKSA